METDFSYQIQRTDLLFKLLKWLVESQQMGASLADIALKADLSEWEVQHLFQEYLGKDPLLVLKELFSPALTSLNKPAQISIFDIFEPTSQVLKPTIDLDIQELIFEPRTIYYSKFPYFLGEVFIASHDEGICQVTFEDSDSGLPRLQKTYPTALLVEEKHALNQLAYEALMCFFVPQNEFPVIPVAVKGSPFQIRVWNELIELKQSQLTTYGDLAHKLGDSNASRAVGTAVGANPIALLIPCHRVVHQSGKNQQTKIGHFRWKSWRKQLLLALEK